MNWNKPQIKEYDLVELQKEIVVRATPKPSILDGLLEYVPNANDFECVATSTYASALNLEDSTDITYNGYYSHDGNGKYLEIFRSGRRIGIFFILNGEVVDELSTIYAY